MQGVIDSDNDGDLSPNELDDTDDEEIDDGDNTRVQRNNRTPNSYIPRGKDRLRALLALNGITDDSDNNDEFDGLSGNRSDSSGSGSRRALASSNIGTYLSS